MFFKITRSEFDRFNAQPSNPHLRYGQAWYNYFKLHSHLPTSQDERLLLDSIYNAREKSMALYLIETYFIDESQ